MLLSMTGYGEAHHQGDGLALAVELRSVNNRHLKVVLRAPEPYHLLEPEFEKVLRRTIRRGTVTAHLRVQRPARPGDFKLNAAALSGYVSQIWETARHHGWGDEVANRLCQGVLTLPGVAPEPGTQAFDHDEEWPLIERTLEAAAARLHAMRQEEGGRMADELLNLRSAIADRLEHLRQHLPAVTAAYRDRVLERVRNLLADTGVAVEPDDLIREVAVFAERSDVAEEVVRLASHLDQFLDVVRRETDSPGRKLEFVTQEMFREANTIGSKAGDVGVSKQVVEVKAALEKIKELIANVE